MSVEKLFASLPIAVFWLAFVWIFAIMLSNPAVQQNTLMFWVLVSFMPIWFLANLAGTILLLRHIKNAKWSLD
jgi:hypothetical protein